MTLTLISDNKIFSGQQQIYSHSSTATQCKMRFGIFLPPKRQHAKVPVLYWLSGLTCTEENFITKSGAQRVASELGMAIVIPDTSPRGLNIPHEKDNYDFGEGAGFYVDATKRPWSQNYRMYTYVACELPSLIAANFPVDAKRVGIFGHSMGGHGALIIALKHQTYYKTVSAFAPICSAIKSPWGEKALRGYLGEDVNTWRDYDVCELIKTRGWKGPHILIDQGSKDPFLTSQLKPELLQAVCSQVNVSLSLRMQDSYDHSYYFIATFIEDHLRYHAKFL